MSWHNFDDFLDDFVDSMDPTRTLDPMTYMITNSFGWSQQFFSGVGGMGLNPGYTINGIKDDWRKFTHWVVPDMRRDREVMTQQPNTARRIIYGRAKVAGAIVYAETSGDSSEELNLAVIFAGHPATVEEIYLDDKLITDETFSENAGYIVYEGDQTFASPSLAVLDGPWSMEHKLLGVTYAYIKLIWKDGLFPSGIPTITAVVKGLEVEDPRDSSTAWSDNAALCVYDFMRRPIKLGGMGCAASEIDLDLVKAAADICDEAVSDGTSTEARYTCNGTMTLDGSPQANLHQMLTALDGVCVYTSGKWHLYAGAPGVVSAALDESWLSGGGISFSLGGNSTDKINTVKATLYDAGRSWEMIDSPVIQSATYLAEDGGEELVASLALPFTSSVATAQRLATIAMQKSRLGLVVQMSCNYKPLLGDGVSDPLAVNDVVTVDNEGLGWSARRFRVLDIRIGLTGVELTLGEDSATLYDWSVGDVLTIASPAPVILPDPYTVTAPTNLVVATGPTHHLTLGDGSIMPRAFVTWDAAGSAFIIGYDIQYKPTTETDYISAGRVTDTQAYIPAIVAGVTYDVRVRAVNDIGAKSSWLETTHAAVGETTAPDDPSSFSWSPEVMAIRLSWDYPTPAAAPIKHIEIWTGSSTPTTKLAVVTGDSWLHTNLASAQTVKYWIRAVSTSLIAADYFPSGGLAATAGDDPALILDAIAGSIRESQLTQDLLARINQVDNAAEAVLEAVLAQDYDFDQGAEARGRITIAEQNITTLDDGLTAEAQARLVLAAVVDGHAAAIVSEQTARASADSALASDITSLAATVSGNSAAIVSEQTARADADSALASDVSTLTTTVSGHTTSISQQATSINGLEAQYTLKIDNNGFPAGFGLASSAVDGTPFSEFVAIADRFAIVNLNTTPITVSSITRSGSTATLTTSIAHGLTGGDPFVVVGTAQQEYNGAQTVASVLSSTSLTFTVSGTPATPATVASGFGAIKLGRAAVPFVVESGEVYIDTAVIKDASITGAKIGSATITSANIANLDAAKITSGTITGRTLQTASSGTRLVVSSADGQVHYYGDRGDGTIEELVTIGASTYGADQVLATFVRTEQNSGYGVVVIQGGGTAFQASNYGGHATANYGIKANVQASATGQDIAMLAIARNVGIWGSANSTASVGKGVIGEGNQYDFYANGSGSNYGPFTGAHDALVDRDLELELGDIVIDLEVVGRRSLSSTITSIAPSSEAMQSAVVGVLVLLTDWQAGTPAALADLPGAEALYSEQYRLASINSVGEGQVNVCRDGGDIAVGDLICSSDRDGKGMRQADDVVRSYTVAKAREAVAWGADDDEIKTIACSYHCG